MSRAKLFDPSYLPVPNELDEEEWDKREQDIICKLCQKEGLHWELTDKGWKLHTYVGLPHVCDIKDIGDLDMDELG